MKTPTTKTLVTAILGALIAGLAIGWIIFGQSSTVPATDSSVEAHDHQAQEIWTCSMHPQIRSNEPGQCPICGMNLVRLGDKEINDNSRVVSMSPNALRLANVQTTIVGRENAAREIRTTGKVQADERKVFSQTTHVPGRIEQLKVNYTGEYVHRGQTLAVLYSPDLITAQQELFEAYKVRESQPGLYAAAREKLRNWRFSERYVDNLVEKGTPVESFPISADVSGIVLKKNVNLGDYIGRGTPLYEIADLSRVWILLDVYENDMPWVRVGDPVVFSAQSLPGQSFHGTITFIDPVLDPQTRVASARVEMVNDGMALKPGMFVNGVVESAGRKLEDVLIIPKSAVMWTGERSVVYLKRETDQNIGFEMRMVTLGPSVSDGYVVRDGLDADDEIVTHGTFAVDAAAQLAGKPSMMNRETLLDKGNYPKITSALTLYVSLKDALVRDDFKQASTYVTELQRVVTSISMSDFTSRDHDEWMKCCTSVREIVSSMTGARTLEGLREQFKPLSERMIQIAKYFGAPAGHILYVQHCPMADNNKGADWLSREPDIRNPYFGAAMTSCGEVVEEIK